MVTVQHMVTMTKDNASELLEVKPAQSAAMH